MAREVQDQANVNGYLFVYKRVRSEPRLPEESEFDLF